MKKYIVELTTEERSQLNTIIKAPRMAAYKRRHAQMLLAADAGPAGPTLKDVDIAAAFGCTTKTVERLVCEANRLTPFDRETRPV